MVKRAVLAPIIEKLEKKQRFPGGLEVALSYTTSQAFNVVGACPRTCPPPATASGVVVIGAHYDHLGFGEHHSLSPDSHVPHLGADDNASGTATVLEIAAGELAAKPMRWRATSCSSRSPARRRGRSVRRTSRAARPPA
jgi:hypothetical protein